MFFLDIKDYFLERKFLFFPLTSTRKMIALHSFGKRFHARFFVWIFWLELRVFSQGVWFFDKFMSSGDESILTESQSQVFADFDISLIPLKK